jgi:hypothetical protein
MSLFVKDVEDEILDTWRYYERATPTSKCSECDFKVTNLRQKTEYIHKLTPLIRHSLRSLAPDLPPRLTPGPDAGSRTVAEDVINGRRTGNVP